VVFVPVSAKSNFISKSYKGWGKGYGVGRWFSPGPPVSSTNRTDRHDIIEILLTVALNTIKQTNKH
jgi:hypothetical protein